MVFDIGKPEHRLSPCGEDFGRTVPDGIAAVHPGGRSHPSVASVKNREPQTVRRLRLSGFCQPHNFALLYNRLTRIAKQNELAAFRPRPLVAPCY